MPPLFHASLTSASVGELNNLQHIWQRQEQGALFDNVLVSPLFARASTLERIRSMAGEWAITFDSGGFYTQQSLVSYREAYRPLLDFYLANDWADRVILPDCVPSATDGPRTVAQKVKLTISGSLRFFQHLPERLKRKAIPVVHGRTSKQVLECMQAYREAGFSFLGFGSFGTTGRRESINRFTRESERCFRVMLRAAQEFDLKVHVFGIGNPPSLSLFRSLKIHSFDCSSWIRSAGFGNVYLPYLSEIYLGGRSQRRRTVSREDFEQLKEQTRHHCRFCEKFDRLIERRYDRALHNLQVFRQVLREPFDAHLFETLSPRYFSLQNRLA